MTRTDPELHLELDNKAMKAAGWAGWRYGIGVACLITFAFVNADPNGWHWVIPAFISGATFVPLGAHLFRWMETIRQNTRSNR